MFAMLLMDSPEWNINKLNELLELYNKIVRESDKEVVKKLAKSDDFKELRERIIALLGAIQ